MVKGAGVNLFEASVREVSGFCTGTDTSSLHKMAVWSDVSPWCSFVEVRMLSLCLEITKLMSLVVSWFINGLGSVEHVYDIV